MHVLATISRSVFATAILFLGVYAVRHYVFSVFRLFLRNVRDYSELEGFDLPRLSVIVPMHNEAQVAADILQALMDNDYDPERIEVLAVNDRSEDDTGAIIDAYAANHAHIRAFHRTSGNGGKAGALEFGTRQATGEIIIVFDADYVPGRGILKMLAAPFADPQIGAVMGRVVPINAGASLMSGLLALERAAGYQVVQQARFNLGLCPQFGGTVGGVRASALRALGGWNTKSITEDTDLTCRLLLAGWRIAYVNRAECYEQVPESWHVRREQLRRWVIGHTQCLHQFSLKLFRSPFLGFWQRIDLLLMLACYWTAPVLVIGWVASVVLFALRYPLPADFVMVALLMIGSQMFASQAGFFELSAASVLDQELVRALLLPFTILSFFSSTGAICAALFTYYSRTILGKGEFDWVKTKRYSTPAAGSNGIGSNNGGNSRRRDGTPGSSGT